MDLLNLSVIETILFVCGLIWIPRFTLGVLCIKVGWIAIGVASIILGFIEVWGEYRKL